MKYGFNLSISGEVSEENGVAAHSETIVDIQKLVMDSFPHDLMHGVTVGSIHLTVHEQQQFPPAPQATGAPRTR